MTKEKDLAAVFFGLRVMKALKISYKFTIIYDSEFAVLVSLAILPAVAVNRLRIASILMYMIATLCITFGLFIRAYFLRFADFNQRDAYVFGAAIFSALVVFAALGGQEVVNREAASLAFPLVVAAVFSYGFRQVLMSQINELLMFLYALVACVLFFDYALSLTRMFNMVESGVGIFLFAYLVVTFVLVFTKKLEMPSQNAGKVVSFMVASIIIGVLFIWSMLQYEQTLFDYTMLGYISLGLLANIYYVLALAPIPGRRESFTHRVQEVEAFSNTLGSLYIDHDARPILVSIIILLVLGLTSLAILSFFNIYTAAALALLLGSHIAVINIQPQS